ncbi:hypothetical protein HUJ04_004982 [Dendroctonus ponderosae]|nr:hypothetical protein HUJ04_004982 [Dendroctonus ponderosae]KAH1015291.1 hypothetical protein HUJ05_013046 [Dendroctonus ponderosae]
MSQFDLEANTYQIFFGCLRNQYNKPPELQKTGVLLLHVTLLYSSCDGNEKAIGTYVNTSLRISKGMRVVIKPISLTKSLESESDWTNLMQSQSDITLT